MVLLTFIWGRYRTELHATADAFLGRLMTSVRMPAPMSRRAAISGLSLIQSAIFWHKILGAETKNQGKGAKGVDSRYS